MTAWSEAPEVQVVAERLIKRWHRVLDDSGVEIRYVFRDEHATSKGKAVIGKARLVSGFTAWLAAEDAGRRAPSVVAEGEKFFVIEIAQDVWKALDDEQRMALVDHELCHLAIDDEDSHPYIVGHDVEEFTAVIARHGLWRPEVELFVKATQQGRLFDVIDGDGEEGGDDE